MKIISSDLFARENISEKVIAVNIVNLSAARVMVDALNKDISLSKYTYYSIVDDDYQLYIKEK